MSNIISQLDQVLTERKQEAADKSYVASLYQKGTEKILKKVAEESAETLMAAKDNDHNTTAENQAHLVYEVADLWFHTLILLHQQGLKGQDVVQELERRFGLSGHDEKANRTPEK